MCHDGLMAIDRSHGLTGTLVGLSEPQKWPTVAGPSVGVSEQPSIVALPLRPPLLPTLTSQVRLVISEAY